MYYFQKALMEGNHKNLTGVHNIRHNNFEINR